MIPSYKEMMFSILRFIGERGSVDRKEVCKFVAEHYKFSDDELSQRIPSGMLLYVNRAGWALSYFAGNKEVVNLPDTKKPVKKTGRGVYEITDLGKQILKSKDAQAKFEAWYDEIYKNKSTPSAEISQTATQEKTPIDVIAETADELAQNLKSQILDEISQKKPSFFEYLVARLLEKMGYGVGRLTKSGADGGIDEDELGLSQIYVQAKSWQGTVLRPEIQKFVGAISDKQTKRAYLSRRPNLAKMPKNTPQTR
ncbi:restriction endonuclease [Campylobacter rectus]|uniref:restriction endonuclease n=1 Tax=Campylobacter rectus TaxID=203 RepID=UPI0036F37EC9